MKYINTISKYANKLYSLGPTSDAQKHSKLALFLVINQSAFSYHEAADASIFVWLQFCCCCDIENPYPCMGLVHGLIHY